MKPRGYLSYWRFFLPALVFLVGNAWILLQSVDALRGFAYEQRQHLSQYVIQAVETTLQTMAKGKPLAEQRRMIEEAVRSTSYGENGYLFLLDYTNHRVLYTEGRKDLNGASLEDLEGTSDIAVFKAIFSAVAGGQNVVHYRFVNPASGQLEDKVSYVHLLPDLGLVIGSGAYPSDTQALWDKTTSYVFEAFALMIGLTIFCFVGFSMAESLYVRKIRNSLHRKACTDKLTGLHNRHMLEYLKKGRVPLEGAYAVIYLDLDNFKPINDSLGHEVGDKVLIEMGHMFRRVVRREDLVCRIGGDEFVVILRNVQEEGVAESIAQVLSHSIHEVPDRVQVDMPLSASIGIAMGDSRSGIGGVGYVIDMADQAMYHVKALNKGGIAIGGWAPTFATRHPVDIRKSKTFAPALAE